MTEYEDTRSTYSRNALSDIAMRFIGEYFSYHNPPYLSLSREDDDDVKDIRIHDSRSLHPTLSNALRLILLASFHHHQLT